MDDNVRQGDELDVDIAIGDRKLTDEELTTILTPLGFLDTFHQLPQAQQDVLGKILFLLWSFGNIGKEILHADGDVIGLVPEMKATLDASGGQLSETVASWLAGSVSTLFADPDQSSELAPLVQKYIAEFSDTQKSLQRATEENKSAIGIDGVRDYLVKFRQAKIRAMQKMSEQLNELLLELGYSTVVSEPS